MKDFLIKESSQIVIYGQTPLFKNWQGEKEVYEFYFSEGTALNFLSIQKKDAFISVESSDNEYIFHKLVASLKNPKTPKVVGKESKDTLRLDRKANDWQVRSYSKYVEIHLTGMSVDEEEDCLKVFKFKDTGQGTVVLRIKDFRLIQKIEHQHKIITLAPLYPSITKVREEQDIMLIEEEDKE